MVVSQTRHVGCQIAERFQRFRLAGAHGALRAVHVHEAGVRSRQPSVSEQETQAENGPDGEIPPAQIAPDNPAPEPALVLPALDTASLSDVPDIHLCVLGEAEQRRACAGPPQRAHGCVGFEGGNNLRRA